MESEKLQKLKTYLNTPTPFSKYFALTLFIILPFVGSWIGYKYGKSQKITEFSAIYNSTLSTVKQKDHLVLTDDSNKLPSSTLEQEELSITILRKLKGIPPSRNLSILLAGKRYQVIQDDYSWKSELYIIDLEKREVTDKLLAGYDKLVLIDDGFVVVDMTPDRAGEEIIRYIIDTPKTEKLTDLEIKSPTTYREYYSAHESCYDYSPIGIIATTSNSITLGVYRGQTIDDYCHTQEYPFEQTGFVTISLQPLEAATDEKTDILFNGLRTGYFVRDEILHYAEEQTGVDEYGNVNFNYEENTTPLHTANTKTFKVIAYEPYQTGTIFAIDDTHAYFESQILEEVDLNSIKTFGKGDAFLASNRGLYLWGKLITSLDSAEDYEIYNISHDDGEPYSPYGDFVHRLSDDTWFIYDTSGMVQELESKPDNIGEKW